MLVQELAQGSFSWGSGISECPRLGTSQFCKCLHRETMEHTAEILGFTISLGCGSQLSHPCSVTLGK